MVRLLRARLADAFLLPASALSRVGESDRVLLVAPTGRAEVRSVVVADRGASDAVITQGLDAGDAVIVETSQPVGAGARVRMTEETTGE
jgi:UDP-N-acetyl-D-mannosaminuronate dehydrogenase